MSTSVVPVLFAQLDSSTLLLAGFVAVGILVGILYQVGLIGWLVVKATQLFRDTVTAGFVLWRRLFSWPPWPVFVALVIGVHVFAWSSGTSEALRAILSGLVLLLLGVSACLAYVYLDLERYEVGRGFKALHNPLKGQELAVNLARYGHRVGIPLLIAATIAIVSGFSFFNLGLYDTIGKKWYAVRYDNHPERAAESAAAEEESPPNYADFLAYTLINLSRVVDLVDVASTYNVAHISYVHQAKWPAATLLAIFKIFFTAVLLQQIFASVRQFKLLSETIENFWSPHEPIFERARGSLSQHGAAAVRPLLQSLRSVAFLTAEQRTIIPAILAEIGPSTIPILLKHLNDPQENVRSVVVSALGQLHALEALPLFMQTHRDPSEWVRQSLVEALGVICSRGTHVIRKKWFLRRSLQRSRSKLEQLRRVKEWLLPDRELGPVDWSVALLRLLLADAAVAVRTQAAATLGQLGADAAPAAPDLIGLLKDAEDSVCCQAARSLGAIGGPAGDVVPALTVLLTDASAAVRIAAIRALGARRDEAAAAIPSLIPLLQDRDESVRQAAAEALREMGTLDEENMPQLVEGLASRDNTVRAQTAEVLGTIGTRAADAVPALMDALGDANDQVRAKAAEALGKMGPAAAQAVPRLVRTLRDKDNRVSALAAAALGEIGEAAVAAVPELLQALRHLNPEVRASVAHTLGQLGAPAARAVEALERTARDEEGSVRRQAIWALGEIGATSASARQTILAAFEDADPQVRTAAVATLGKQTDGPAMLAPLIQALDDSNDDVKIEAAATLGRLGMAEPPVLEGLCRLLEDDNASVQLLAAQALGKLGPDAAAAGAPLLRALQVADGNVREQVLRAFVLIQPPEAVTAFMVGLKDAEAEQRKLASAGLLKAATIPPEVFPLLIDALKDPEVQVRSNAAGVLGRLENLPDEAIPLLLECTANPDDGLRLNAMRALEAAPPEIVARALHRLTEDPNARIRLLAARFLLAEGSAPPRAVTVLSEALADATPHVRRTALDLLESLGAGAVAVVEIVKGRAEAEEDPELRGRLEQILHDLQQQAATTSAGPATPVQTAVADAAGPA